MPLKNIINYTNHPNIAEELSDDELNKIGQATCYEVKSDLDSRSEWEEQNDMWIELASQLMEEKNDPWPKAANVKYPLLTIASLLFHARIYPTIFNGRDICKYKRVGVDPESTKSDRVTRLSSFTSFYILDWMKDFQQDFDRLLLIVGITGIVYKKTYLDPFDNVVKSPLLLARDVIVNYNANDYDKARVTHRLYYNKNDVLEYINSEQWLDVDLGMPQQKKHEGPGDDIQGTTSPSITDSTTPYCIYESHKYLDLDDDGYEEPYIVTVDSDSQQVLRIKARWDESGIQLNKNKVVRIKALNYFTDYILFPDTESKVMGMGFGKLLGPNNKAVNTILNQLIDSGTLNNLQGGFFGKGIRMQGGNARFQPGEWKQLQTAGDDIRKNIFPLPTKEPSGTLYSLLGTLIQAGQDIGSIHEMMKGESPGQNQPYSTSQLVLQQGLQVYNGIYKRIYDRMDKEFKRIVYWMRNSITDDFYRMVLDDVSASVNVDFNFSDLDVIPAAQPDMLAETEKVAKSEGLLAKVSAGLPINPQEATRRNLEAEGYEDIKSLLQMPPPQPDPNYELELQKFEFEKQYKMSELQIRAFEAQSEAMKDQAQAAVNAAKSENIEFQQLLDSRKLATEMFRAVTERLNTLADAEYNKTVAKESADGESKT